jgi:4-hydroxy-tetrahydrodipicolinate synthase
MNQNMIGGVYAAVLVPRDSQGDLDESALERHLQFLLTHGISNFVFNGATGEYCLASPSDLKRCLQVAKYILPAEATFLCGVGAAGLSGTLMLGSLSIEAGAEGVLVPMPYFFRYTQDDLAAFVRTTAAELPAPILLYNLPQFTSGLEARTVVDLLRECGNIVGIKDSSGSLAIFRELAQAGIPSSRICGNDEVLPQALIEQVCNGAVSGVACVVPELIQALFGESPESPGFHATAAHVREFVSRIDALPCPWGLKAIAEARGICTATYHQPVSAARAKQIRDLQTWFKGWLGGISQA